MKIIRIKLNKYNILVFNLLANEISIQKSDIIHAKIPADVPPPSFPTHKRHFDSAFQRSRWHIALTHWFGKISSDDTRLKRFSKITFEYNSFVNFTISKSFMLSKFCSNWVWSVYLKMLILGPIDLFRFFFLFFIYQSLFLQNSRYYQKSLHRSK